MKIGILGPPGVGKSKLAKGLAKHYGYKVVDNYIQRIQRDTSLALGPWSSYSEHFMVAGNRLLAEERAKADTITVGTILDTITYAAVKTDVTMGSGPDAARAMYDAARAAMQGLALIYRETWDYHLCFHLGYSDKQRVEMDRGWELALDSAYPHVLESFEATYVYGLRGSDAERLEIAIQVIDLAITPETPQAADDETDASSSE